MFTRLGNKVTYLALLKQKKLLKIKLNTMKLTKIQQEKITQCITDLEYYYQTCGNQNDFMNLELLKIHLNTEQINIENIEVIYENVNQIKLEI